MLSVIVQELLTGMDPAYCGHNDTSKLESASGKDARLTDGHAPVRRVRLGHAKRSYL